MDKTRVICVDDHPLLLSQMVDYVRSTMKSAVAVGFGNADTALKYAKEFGCDVLFTEIELYGRPEGLSLARQMQEHNPRVNIVFTTVCSESEYAEEVVRIRPSGYLTKVVTEKDVKGALDNLLYRRETEGAC